ncbi:MAG: ATP-grasp domain-containing protein [Methanomicrobiaceae archaeon]|nr:ATP-grasp domain-containing protein [Methanomicrobiaceae archaeon]
MRRKVLVAGFATRHVVQSAYRAGYDVYAVDHFCDQDLCWYTKDRATFDELDEIPAAIETIASTYPIDIFVVTSGAEDLKTPLPLYGTQPEQVARHLDKLDLQHFFEEHAIPVPGLAAAGEYPCLIKPRRGAGGWRNQILSSEDERRGWEETWPGVPSLCQQVVHGQACSVSCIGDGQRARAVATNEQMLRSEGERAFGFAGSITPYLHTKAGAMVHYAEKAVSLSGCRGSVGVDFIAGETPWAIEINPRFQATVDTVEMATGCNLFSLHVDACRGAIPAAMPEPRRFAARRILFADRDLVVADDLKHLAPRISDIPWVGSEFEDGAAVVSAYGWGSTRAGALDMLDKTITHLRRYMSRW